VDVANSGWSVGSSSFMLSIISIMLTADFITDIIPIKNT